MMKKEQEAYKATIPVSALTKAMVFVGLIGLVGVNLFTEEYLKTHIIFSYILKVVDTVASALFSAGLVSVIVEISTIKNLVSDAFRKILLGEFPVSGLNEEALRQINKKVASTITSIPDNKIENTVYRYERNLLELMVSKYYIYHNFTYHITPDEKNNCFHIRVKIHYKMINDNLVDNTFDLRMKMYSLKEDMTCKECIDALDIKALRINNKDISLEDVISAEPVRHETESSTYYNYKVRLYKELTEKKNTIFAEFSYDVPMHDICQSFRISVPCKELEHKFYINSDVQTGEEWIIKANAYSTFYHSQSEENSNYSVEQNTDTSIIIRYKNWALVGNGYCVIYQKRYQKDNNKD